MSGTGIIATPARTEAKRLVVIDQGIAAFRLSYELQRELVNQKKRDSSMNDFLIFVEHPEVYTYGRKSSNQRKEGLPVGFYIERGGGVTYHNIGQLVCYPILYLGEQERDIHLYLRKIEDVVISMLMDFGLAGERQNGATGVWLSHVKKKVASIGVAVSGWVTYHGCAINVSNDLCGFSRINPCGFSPEIMASMKSALGNRNPSIQRVKSSFLRHFLAEFGRWVVA